MNPAYTNLRIQTSESDISRYQGQAGGAQPNQEMAHSVGNESREGAGDTGFKEAMFRHCHNPTGWLGDERGICRAGAGGPSEEGTFA